VVVHTQETGWEDCLSTEVLDQPGQHSEWGREEKGEEEEEEEEETLSKNFLCLQKII
jgi:hypothetical protein